MTTNEILLFSLVVTWVYITLLAIAVIYLRDALDALDAAIWADPPTALTDRP